MRVGVGGLRVGLGLGWSRADVTSKLGRERRMEVVSLRSSVTRGITIEMRNAQRAASVRT